MPPSKQRHVLAKLRQHLNVTQSHLAAWCACSPATIQSIEAGRLVLSRKLAERINLVTGAPVEWLLKNHLRSEVPNLIRKGTQLGTFVGPDNSRAMVFSAVVRALRTLESIQSNEGLTLFNYYTLEYYAALEKAFGQLSGSGSDLERLNYLKAQIDAFLSPTPEEQKRDEEAARIVKEQITPLADALEADLSKRAKKEQPQHRKAQRQSPASP
jgi:hypothetical protein